MSEQKKMKKEALKRQTKDATELGLKPIDTGTAKNLAFVMTPSK